MSSSIFFWAVQLFEMKIEKSYTKMPFLFQNKKVRQKEKFMIIILFNNKIICRILQKKSHCSLIF